MIAGNHALVTGPTSDFGFACLDEFHYYADRDRGWAWQVPLLELTSCQMLLALRYPWPSCRPPRLVDGWRLGPT